MTTEAVKIAKINQGSNLVNTAKVVSDTGVRVFEQIVKSPALTIVLSCVLIEYCETIRIKYPTGGSSSWDNPSQITYTWGSKPLIDRDLANRIEGAICTIEGLNAMSTSGALTGIGGLLSTLLALIPK